MACEFTDEFDDILPFPITHLEDTMGPYPVTIYVTSTGTLVPASKTDQAHWSHEKFKRVRTASGKLCVSAGLWDISQLRFKPFQEACVEARQEAEDMERRGHKIQTPRTPLISLDAFREYIRDNNHGMSDKSQRALRLVVVEGWDFTGAARAAGFNKPEVNGRIHVKRLYRALKRQFDEDVLDLNIACGQQ